MNRQGADRSQNLAIPFAIILGATLVFTVLYLLTVPEALASMFSAAGPLAMLMNLITSPIALFLVAMIVAWLGAETVLIQAVQRLYALSSEEATEFTHRILYGLPELPPFSPILSVREGRVDPEGPEVMRKVGGPGFLSIGHDSAAVIMRGGRIVRVLGPGWYRLEAFERVWDVVDLRPQHRTLHVETNTRDGIPIYCDAEMRFRLDNGQEPPRDVENYPYPFTDKSEENALKATTSKVVLAPGGARRFTTWDSRMPNGILDGEMRNQLERFYLDDFLRVGSEGVTLLQELERRIEAAVQEQALGAGVRVEWVHLGPVLPCEDAISQQWIETWRSEWDRVAHQLKAEVKAMGTAEVKLARVYAQAELLNDIIEKAQQLNARQLEIPREFVLMRFMDVTRSLSESNPLVRSTMFKEAEGLKRILTTMMDWTEEPTNGDTENAGDATYPALVEEE